MTSESVWEEIVELYSKKAGKKYMCLNGVSHRQHALQTYARMKKEKPDNIKLQISALLHNIGHLLDETKDSLTGKPDRPEARGALWLMNKGLPLSVVMPIRHHINAERYQYFKDPKSKLGKDSCLCPDTLMDHQEADLFSKCPYFEQAMLLSRCCEASDEDHNLPNLKDLKDLKDKFLFCFPNVEIPNLKGYYHPKFV